MSILSDLFDRFHHNSPPHISQSVFQWTQMICGCLRQYTFHIPWLPSYCCLQLDHCTERLQLRLTTYRMSTLYVFVQYKLYLHHHAKENIDLRLTFDKDDLLCKWLSMSSDEPACASASVPGPEKRPHRLIQETRPSAMIHALYAQLALTRRALELHRASSALLAPSPTLQVLSAMLRLYCKWSSISWRETMSVLVLCQY